MKILLPLIAIFVSMSFNTNNSAGIEVSQEEFNNSTLFKVNNNQNRISDAEHITTILNKCIKNEIIINKVTNLIGNPNKIENNKFIYYLHPNYNNQLILIINKNVVTNYYITN